MSHWLRKEETPFTEGLYVQGGARSQQSAQKYSIVLRTVRVFDNKKLFGSAEVILYTIVVDGFPDMESQTPFWSQQLNFSNVKDGAVLPIDAEQGWLIYKGRPDDFLNVYFVAVRNKQAIRDLTTILRENMVAEGIGTVAGAAISVFAGAPETVPITRDLTTKAVEVTLDYLKQQKNPVIGVYYGSLLREKGFGVGLHPEDYPVSLIPCGGALEIAYQVLGV